MEKDTLVTKEKQSGYDIAKAEIVRLRSELAAATAAAGVVRALRFTLHDLKKEYSDTAHGPTGNYQFNDDYIARH